MLLHKKNERRDASSTSLILYAVFGATPFGSLLAGTLADRIGAPRTVILTGVFCLAGSAWFTLELPRIRAIMRPIYQEMGLLPVPGLNLISELQQQ